MLELQEASNSTFAGIGMPLNATSFCQTFRDRPSILGIGATGFPGNRHSEQADGLCES